MRSFTKEYLKQLYLEEEITKKKILNVLCENLKKKPESIKTKLM